MKLPEVQLTEQAKWDAVQAATDKLAEVFAEAVLGEMGPRGMHAFNRQQIVDRVYEVLKPLKIEKQLMHRTVAKAVQLKRAR